MDKYNLNEIRKNHSFSGGERDLMTTFPDGTYTLDEIRELLQQEMKREVA